MESKMSIDIDGNKLWKLASVKYHREDGPAIEWNNGDKHWYKNGQRHREDGPASIWNDGRKEPWFLNGIKYTEKEYKLEMRSIKLKKLLV